MQKNVRLDAHFYSHFTSTSTTGHASYDRLAMTSVADPGETRGSLACKQIVIKRMVIEHGSFFFFFFFGKGTAYIYCLNLHGALVEGTIINGTE